MQSELEQRLKQAYGYVKNKTNAEMDNATIEEQMAYELFKVTKIKAGPYISILDKMSEKIVIDKGYRLIKKEKRKYGSANYLIKETGYFFAMKLLEAFINIMKLIEKTSINYLNKTRPDVAYMMKEGKSFHEIAKQYFKNNN